MDTPFNFARDFSQGLASRLLERIELSARQEPNSAPSKVPTAQPQAFWGWGRFLNPPQQRNLDAPTVQIGTFGTCDALRTMDRIQRVCKVYHRGSRVVPSARLEGICGDARQSLRETCERFIGVITAEGSLAVSTPRFDKLLGAVFQTPVSNDKLLFHALEALHKQGKPLSDDRPETIGWGWFLDKLGEGFPARCGPTELMLDALVAIEPLCRAGSGAALAEIVPLIDSSADYVCSQFESGYRRSASAVCDR